MRIRALAVMTTALVSLASGGAAYAQAGAPASKDTGLEEVVVTSQRFASGLQTTPIAVSALSPAMLEQRQINNVQDLNGQVPGILITGAAGISTITRIVLRGVGQESGGALFDPAVGIYLDNIYQPRAQGQFFDLFDVERIEVLRGPQGTLYGRNTSGGAVKIVTKSPSFKLTYGGDVAVGNYNAVDIRGYISGPIVSDKVAGSLGFVTRRRNGILAAPAYGEDINARNSLAVRGKLLIKPTDKLDIELALGVVRDHNDVQVGTPVLIGPGVVNPKASLTRDLRTTELFGARASKNDSEQASVNIVYRLTDSVTLSSISGYGSIRNITDTPLAMLAGGGLAGTSWTVSDRFYSQEFNVAYATEKLNLTGGVYYFYEHGFQTDRAPYSTPATKDRTGKAGAVFAQANYKLTDALSIVAGLRYTNEDQELTQFYPTQRTFKQTGSKSFSATTPKIGLDWKATDDLFLYASFTKGFKSGGFNAVPPNTNTGGQGDGKPTPYNAEEVDSYEVGAKYTTPDKRFRLNAALFRAKYTGMQLPVFFPGTVSSYTSNAAGAQVDGLELEPVWQVTEGLQFYGALAFLDGKYTSPFQCSISNTSIVNCQDRKLKGVSPFKSTLGGSYVLPITAIPGELTVTMDWQHVDRFFNNVSNTLPIAATPKHDLLNASLTWRSPSREWAVSLEGKNITDEQYFEATVQLANAISPSLTAYANEPRTVQVRVRANF